MKVDAFEQFVRSVRQAGRIRRGAATPSRVDHFDPEDVKSVR
jgi:hypothetical protein